MSTAARRRTTTRINTQTSWLASKPRQRK